MTRAQLIAAIATATTPTYDLDVAVYNEIYGPPEVLNQGQQPDRPDTYKWVHDDGWLDKLPNYTGSIDIVLEIIHLRLMGVWWVPNIRQNGNAPSWVCTITRANPTLVSTGVGTSAGRALLVAFLRALPV